MEVQPPSPPHEQKMTRPGNDCGASFRLTTRKIQRFLSDREEDDYQEETIRQYRRALTLFYDFLPEDKRVCQDTISQWYQSLLEQGYSTRTAGTRLSAVNSLLDHLGQRDIQWHIKMECSRMEPQRLTREEYLKLLQEARRQENITLYLLVKTFAVAGLPLQCLPDLTREALNCGVVQTDRKKYNQKVILPAGLRQELLDYAVREDIHSGPVFRNDAGAPFRRMAVTNMISRLGETAGLEPGKANPRNLKRLYQTAFAEYQRQADAWMQASYAHLLAEEEQQIGWLSEKSSEI